MINHFLSLAAPEQEWSHILINGLTIGAGDISAEDLFAVLKKRIERVLIRTVRQPCFYTCSYYSFFVFYLTDVVSLICPWFFSFLHSAQKQRREVLTNSGFWQNTWKALKQEQRRLFKCSRGDHNSIFFEPENGLAIGMSWAKTMFCMRLEGVYYLLSRSS